ncbi:uncharacterized protein IAS62_004512 [Cryptococcus decagattii]|uniref:Uncharacterized protein n=1 Tax=Cryptococcus decagattii TaxID=1859122 RepID=A0ABZ2AXA1_9TREE
MTSTLPTMMTVTTKTLRFPHLQPDHHNAQCPVLHQWISSLQIQKSNCSGSQAQGTLCRRTAQLETNLPPYNVHCYACFWGANASSIWHGS